MGKIDRMLISGYFRRRKKEWSSISIVVFLCVLFFTSIISSCMEAVNGIEEYTKMRYGSHQFQAFQVDEGHVSYPEANIGIMELEGYFLNEVSLYYDPVILGVVDDAAIKIGNLSLNEGRMPKEKGEIAIESSVLKRMDVDVSVGDEISLPVYWAEDGKYQQQTSNETFKITGIIRDYSRIWKTDSSDPYSGFPGIWLSEKENERSGIRVELLQFDNIETPVQAEEYYQELSSIYGDTITYNINSYMASEDDSVEARKSMYLSIAAFLMGCAVVIIMIIGIISILSLGIEERKKQQKILYQLGMTPRRRFFVLCKQIYLASLIGIVPGILCSILLIKGLKILLFRVLGIYVTGQLTFYFILVSVFPILIVVGIINAILYKMINRTDAPKIKKSKIQDYVQRIFNGSFPVQRACSIILLSAALMIILPVQGTIQYYKGSFAHPLEKDVNMRLESFMTVGSLQISEGRQGITMRDYDRLMEINGLEDMSYAMQLESAKILLPDESKEDLFLRYRSDSETVPQIENIDIGDGVDYVARDKKYYGYTEENVLIPCTIQGVEWNTVQQLSDYLIEGKIEEQSYLSGEETLVVVWEEEYEKAAYPIQVGDTLCLSNLVQTKVSQNYYQNPDEAKRVDSNVKIGGILKVPLDFAEELGCNSVRGSYTFLRSLEALEKDGYDLSFQSITFNYSKNADMRVVDEEVRDIISRYNYVSFESKYEKQKAAQEFESVVFILGGSIAGLGLCLAILLIYQKMISTMLLKKRQLHIMWCMGMHKGYLKKVVITEGLRCIAAAVVIAMVLLGVAVRFWKEINLIFAGLFIIGGGIVAFLIFCFFVLRWMDKHFYTNLVGKLK